MGVFYRWTMTVKVKISKLGTIYLATSRGRWGQGRHRDLERAETPPTMQLRRCSSNFNFHQIGFQSCD